MSSANISAKLTSEVRANLEDAVAKLKQLAQELSTAQPSSTLELDAERAELKAYRLELEADRLEWEASRSSRGGGSSNNNIAELEAEREDSAEACTNQAQGCSISTPKIQDKT